ncbi:MAG TPA: glucose 1-dehydrogenase [Rhizobiaceae bacterium]|nr:glucose 1-dehydrogenase [Rhizobiaceae bacterium]
MDRRLEGRVAIVTGAAQGIGAAYAEALAHAGASVCVADIEDAGPVAAAIIRGGGKALAAGVDVTDPASVEAMVGKTASAFGTVDILVNNAAIFGRLAVRPFAEITSAEWDKVQAVNVRGVFECCKAVFPIMREKGSGRIVNVASGTVFKGAPLLLHYVTSKGAVLVLTRALAREVGEHGICVNCIAPGLTLSESIRANPSYDQAFVAANTASRSLRREAVPADLIGPLLFLCSEESAFMTGQTVVVDGGSVMH